MTIKQAPQGTIAQGDGLLEQHSMNSLTKTQSLGEDKPQTEASFLSAGAELSVRRHRTASPQMSYSRLARFVLLMLLFLVGDAQPCGTLCLQKMVSEVWVVMS